MITASIVVYSEIKNFNIEDFKNITLKECIKDLAMNSLIHEILILDNSPKSLFSWVTRIASKVIYKHMNGINLGYGNAHNLSRKLLDFGKYHIILNPDIKFVDFELIDKLFNFMEINNDISMIQPLIVSYPNNEIQKLCKRNPTLFAQIIRGFFLPFISKLFFLKQYDDWYVMNKLAYKKRIVDSQYLSGCFMFCRVDSLDKVDWFDQSFFMYLEDADLTRKLSSIGRCIHYPYLRVGHLWARGSHKYLRLKLIAIKSFFIYAKKWGLRIF